MSAVFPISCQAALRYRRVFFTQIAPNDVADGWVCTWMVGSKADGDLLRQ